MLPVRLVNVVLPAGSMPCKPSFQPTSCRVALVMAQGVLVSWKLPTWATEVVSELKP